MSEFDVKFDGDYFYLTLGNIEFRLLEEDFIKLHKEMSNKLVDYRFSL